MSLADPVSLDEGAAARLDLLLRGWSEAFADRRSDILSASFAHGRRGLADDEATAFLRGLDAGQLLVDDAGYVVPACVTPKKGQSPYALCCKSGIGVTVNLEYVIQLGVMAELNRELGWPVEQLRVELGEFDGSILDAAGDPTLVMEAKCRRTGPDSLSQLLLKWLRFAEGNEPPVRGRGKNAEHKYLDLLRLTASAPTIQVLLVADGARWWLQAERTGPHHLVFSEAPPLVPA